ncbi:serine/threonine-protein kinase [Alteribacter natronophilus]|uniref:serine/threonine-protein kinase n=1 Tax=Alteribacter natronophilus TaxID=2583810 RepID=UPI00110EE609|nr:serine/threonine-protein kinase [Alteribacter natronophilus]TMW71179.1 serine/threonine protein kinase [Alteribacter natronophilus]
MSIQDKKNKIRRFIKQEKCIDSPLGPITVEERIGEGGNALVYSSKLGTKQVALKILAEDNKSSKYKRFITEFREIVQLADTGAVVPIYYLGHIKVNDTDYPYMLMRKYPFTLESWKEKNEISNFGDIKGLIIQLFNIVATLHSKGIVHRDLKPENILMTEDNQMVLADFGISWFDPAIYHRFVETRRGDRMANFDFSAPEQFVKGSVAHPTMDIFALGQIITWLITGGVARGNREPLDRVDNSFSSIEPMVSTMLNREIEQRPQSIDDAKAIWDKIIIQNEQNYNLQQQMNKVIVDLEKFNEVLLNCFPGKRGLIDTTDSTKIDMVFTELSEIIGKVNLWWTQGDSNSSIGRKFNKINTNEWVMDSTEIVIEKMWAMKQSHSLDHQFILIKTKAMSDFSIYGDGGKYEWSEAGWFKNKYITREEYDDGVAEMDGTIVKLDGTAEVRGRNLIPQFYFLATQSHPILISNNDLVVSDIYKNLLVRGELMEEDIYKLIRLRKHEISSMLN